MESLTATPEASQYNTESDVESTTLDVENDDDQGQRANQRQSNVSGTVAQTETPENSASEDDEVKKFLFRENVKVNNFVCSHSGRSSNFLSNLKVTFTTFVSSLNTELCVGGCT